MEGAADLGELLQANQEKVAAEWLAGLRDAGILRTGRLREAELSVQCGSFLSLLGKALTQGGDPTGAAFRPVREMLSELSRSRASQGFTPRETALFIFSLKSPLNTLLRQTMSGDPLAEALWDVNRMLDDLGLETMEIYQRSREEVIVRQQQEIAELSTPVVELWQGILALPLIGTLDSQRTQVVMENLLQSIVDRSAEIAIIDITGVPTVDTLTAQHLLKTVSAARLMGADCIISGIRPQIAQTMVHLGVELNVVSKASLADAFALALRRVGRSVTLARGTPAPSDRPV